MTKSLFKINFLCIFGVFWWLHSCQYGFLGCTSCFTHADNHYKPHYKLLTPYVYLILTLCIVKNDKNHFFCVFEVLAQDSTSTRIMKRWGCAWWGDGSPTLFAWLPRRNHLCGTSEHRVSTLCGPFSLSGMDCDLGLVGLDLWNSSRALEMVLAITVYDLPRCP